MSGFTLDCSPTGRVVIADTGAILTGVIRQIPDIVYAPEQVLSEVRDEESRRALEESLNAGRIRIVPGNAISMGAVREAIDTASRIGARKRLSETDLYVIALALEAKKQKCEPIVVTDDYAMQYTLRRLGIRYTSIRYRGIRR